MVEGTGISFNADGRWELGGQLSDFEASIIKNPTKATSLLMRLYRGRLVNGNDQKLLGGGTASLAQSDAFLEASLGAWAKVSPGTCGIVTDTPNGSLIRGRWSILAPSKCVYDIVIT